MGTPAAHTLAQNLLVYFLRTSVWLFSVGLMEPVLSMSNRC